MDSSLTNTPFAVLTTVVAPAILTNASSVLALGTANRIARVVDRTRYLTEELKRHAPDSPVYQQSIRQMARLRSRSQLLVRALRILYAGLGSFAAAALITVLGSALAYYDVMLVFQSLAAAGLLIGIFAVGSLVYGCSLLVRETRLALDQIDEEVADAVADHHSKGEHS
ncbi:MAG: DUF2721 domain-containing protein [Acidobacteria bacterium]|nr:DUF2721 domain-containing protein [Acidobacteriota bacterium]